MITYSELKERGFSREKVTDEVFAAIHGRNPIHVYRTFGRRIILEWNELDKTINLIFSKTDGFIVNERTISTIEELDKVIDELDSLKALNKFINKRISGLFKQ